MQFNISLLSIILLSLLRIEKTVATAPEDAFGITNFGFKCMDRVYEKRDIYAAAKELCRAQIWRPGLSFRIFGDDNDPEQWTQLMLQGLGFPDEQPFSLIPLLDDGTIFPMNKPTVESYNSVTDGVYPGLDRLVIDKNCKVVGAFFDRGHRWANSRRYTKCIVLKYPLDHPLASENPPDPVDPNILAFQKLFYPSTSPLHSPESLEE